MSLASVKAFLAEHAPDLVVIESPTSTATVAEAAATHGVTHGQIAKTLSLRIADRVVLVVTAGDARLDNAKARATLGGKAKIAGEVEQGDVGGFPTNRAMVRLKVPF